MCPELCAAVYCIRQQEGRSKFMGHVKTSLGTGDTLDKINDTKKVHLSAHCS